MTITGSIAASSVLLLSLAAGAASWEVDKDHTQVSFEARHFVTAVRGQFRDFDVNLTYDEQRPENSSVTAVIRVASVNTGNEKRDAHLRTDDWFDAARFPQITFRSTRVERVSPTELRAHGKLKIRDVERDVALPVTITGTQELDAQMQQMMGGVRKITGFETVIEIDRRDFDVGSGSWAMTAVVGAPIRINIVLEAQLR
jgi:polyisoprenoid-binding protein YceI